jgi:hypothetical protein
MIYAPIFGGTTKFSPVFSHLAFDQAEDLSLELAGVLRICVWGRSILR